MRCDEFQAGMRAFLDGSVSGKQRRELGLHIIECPACAALIEENRFWDDAVRRHLDHELPPDLKADILGDLAPHAAGDGVADGALDGLGWRKQWQIALWAIKRDLDQPWKLAGTAAVTVAAMLVVLYLPRLWPSGTELDAGAFRDAGPIVQVGQEEAWSNGESAPTGRLTLSGRLI